jgi:hypothetical protein
MSASAYIIGNDARPFYLVLVVSARTFKYPTRISHGGCKNYQSIYKSYNAIFQVRHMLKIQKTKCKTMPSIRWIVALKLYAEYHWESNHDGRN